MQRMHVGGTSSALGTLGAELCSSVLYGVIQRNAMYGGILTTVALLFWESASVEKL